MSDGEAGVDADPDLGPDADEGLSNEDKLVQQQSKIEELEEALGSKTSEHETLLEENRHLTERNDKLEEERDGDLGALTDELRRDLDEQQANIDSIQAELDEKESVLAQEREDHATTERKLKAETEESHDKDQSAVE